MDLHCCIRYGAKEEAFAPTKQLDFSARMLTLATKRMISRDGA